MSRHEKVGRQIVICGIIVGFVLSVMLAAGIIVP